MYTFSKSQLQTSARLISHKFHRTRNISFGQRLTAPFLRPARVIPSVSTNFGLVQQQARSLNLHEYISTEILQEAGVETSRGSVATTPAEAKRAAQKLTPEDDESGEFTDYVVKAQILAGGRGKGKFTNGMIGGVQVVATPDGVYEIAEQMLGGTLITKQTPPEGIVVDKVFVAERLFLRRETYFAIILDRGASCPVMVASSRGGMDIELVAEQNPKKILKEYVDLDTGPSDAQFDKMAKEMGFSKKATTKAIETMKSLYDLFMKSDATQIEINPLAETHLGRVLCLDAKLNFDENASFRQKKYHRLRDTKQEDSREVEAKKWGYEYIGLDGEVGCLVNGAGLAMATMDIIKLHGGEPANFLDLGGGAGPDLVEKAFSVLNDDPNVKAILVNIFGGIMRCDIIAMGIIASATKLGLKKPVVIRLEGTNLEEAKRLIDESSLRLLTSDDLDDAAAKAVKVADIVKRAEQVHLHVSFELPL